MARDKSPANQQQNIKRTVLTGAGGRRCLMVPTAGLAAARGPLRGLVVRRHDGLGWVCGREVEALQQNRQAAAARALGRDRSGARWRERGDGTTTARGGDDPTQRLTFCRQQGGGLGQLSCAGRDDGEATMQRCTRRATMRGDGARGATCVGHTIPASVASCVEMRGSGGRSGSSGKGARRGGG